MEHVNPEFILDEVDKGALRMMFLAKQDNQNRIALLVSRIAQIAAKKIAGKNPRADDIMQDAVVYCLGHLDSYDATKGDPYSLFYMMASQRVWKFINRNAAKNARWQSIGERDFVATANNPHDVAACYETSRKTLGNRTPRENLLRAILK